MMRGLLLLVSLVMALPAPARAETVTSMEGFRFEETDRGRPQFMLEARRAEPGSYQWKFLRIGCKPVLYLEDAVITVYDARGRNPRVERMARAMFDPAAKTFYRPDGTAVDWSLAR